MTTSSAPSQSELDQFLALYPGKKPGESDYLYPQGAVYPLPSKQAPAGINLASLDETSGELTCWLNIPDNPSGHILDVWLSSDQPSAPNIVHITLPPGSSGLLWFTIPKAKLVEGVIELYGTLTDSGTAKVQKIPRLKLKVDLQAPGGDPDPTGIQQNLPAATATLRIPGEISGEEIRQGLTLSIPAYPGMKQWDTVELKIHGVTLRKRLDAASDVGKPVIFTASAEELSCLIGRKDVEITYTVTDEVGNSSQPAPTTKLAIDYIHDPQPAPTIVEATGATGAVELSSLAGQDLHVEVATAHLQPQEEVTLEWSLATRQGKTLKGTISQRVIASSKALSFELPGANGPALEEGTLVVFYRGTARNRSSKAIATLTGAVTQRALSFGSDVKQAVSLRYIILKGRAPLHPTEDSNGAYQRRATGGTPPYRYSSSNPEVAKVDTDGRVVAAASGSADIVVNDAQGATAKYAITFSGVRVVEVRPNQTWPGQVLSKQRPEYHALSQLQMLSFWEQYRNDDPSKSVAEILGWSQALFWSGDNYYPDGTAFVVDFSQRQPDFRGEARKAGGTSLPTLSRVDWS